MKDIVFESSSYGFSAKVEKVDAVYKLSWNDQLVNEWEEFYPDLSVSVARLATLIKASESNFEKGFARTPDEFEKNFEGFVSKELV
jgi:hypothetical protein